MGETVGQKRPGEQEALRAIHIEIVGRDWRLLRRPSHEDFLIGTAAGNAFVLSDARVPAKHALLSVCRERLDWRLRWAEWLGGYLCHTRMDSNLKVSEIPHTDLAVRGIGGGIEVSLSEIASGVLDLPGEVHVLFFFSPVS